MPTPPVPFHVPAFQVTGISARTCNSDEMNPATARIGELWDVFFSRSWERSLPRPQHDERIFGVYSAYESDQHGAFDVTAGVVAAAPDPGVPGTSCVSCAPASHRGPDGPLIPVNAHVVAVQAGDYLVFTVRGPCRRW